MTFQIGAGNMIEGFDDAVRGKSEGEIATSVTTPPEGPLAGKEVELSVAIKGVRERELPTADDEFAEMASEFDTIEELRDDLAQRLARVKLVEQGIEGPGQVGRAAA
jgi:trigger factor